MQSSKMEVYCIGKPLLVMKTSAANLDHLGYFLDWVKTAAYNPE